MAKIVRLPTRAPRIEGIDALCAQLCRVEGAFSPDQATMDAITEAERRILTALGNAQSGTIAEVSQKIAAVQRRAMAADGFLSEGELELLDSALADLRRIDPASAVA